MPPRRIKGLDDNIKKGARRAHDESRPLNLVEMRFQIDPDLCDQIDFWVKKHGTFRSNLIRMFIREGLDRLAADEQ